MSIQRIQNIIRILIILVITSAKVLAQEQPTGSIGFNLHYGILVAHRSNIHHLSTAHIGIYELCIERKTTNEEWAALYHKPVVGISFLYTELGHNKYLGKGVAVLPYIDIPLIPGKHSSFSLKVASGLGIISKPFDREKNYKQIAIGSKINGSVSLLARYRCNITPKLIFCAGTGITHFSNAAFKTPNLGINMWTVNTQLSYNFIQLKKNELIKDSTVLVKRWVTETFLIGGIKEIYPAGGNKYFTKSITFNFLKTLNAKSRAGFGIDLFYDASIKEKMKRDSIPHIKNKDAFKQGITADYELVIGKFSIPMQMGIYVPSHYNDNGHFYHRFGWRYAINNHWKINATLKTHFAKADYFEWGAGYTF